MSSKRESYTILRDINDEEIECETDLLFNLTEEGLIVDLVDGEGEVIESWGWTAQEFFDYMLTTRGRKPGEN